MEKGVTLVPGRAALSPGGQQIAAVSSLQESVWVVEVTDLKLEHPSSTRGLSTEREQQAER